MPDKSPETLRGYFEYVELSDGWLDSFRVVDDDAMPFDLATIKRFVGRAVKITIEIDVERDDLDGEVIDSAESNAPFVYQTIGLTKSDYRESRKEMHRRFNQI